MQVVKKSETVVTHIVLILGTAVMLYPLLFAFLGSFLSVDQFYKVGFLPIPRDLTHVLENYRRLLIREELYRSLGITLARTLWYVLIIGATSLLGGYAFAKVNFKGKKIAFYVLMSSMMIPGVALLTPQYMMFAQFPLVGGNDIFGKGGNGLIDNLAVLFITGCFSAYNIFLLRQSFLSLGDEFREAAEVDGAGYFRTIFMVYTPMVKPAIAVIIINLFIGQWNDYLFPLIFVAGKKELFPIGVTSVRIMNDLVFDSGLQNYPVAMATAIVMMIPPVAVYVAFQKYFVSGLTLGGVKS